MRAKWHPGLCSVVCSLKYDFVALFPDVAKSAVAVYQTQRIKRTVHDLFGRNHVSYGMRAEVKHGNAQSVDGQTRAAAAFGVQAGVGVALQRAKKTPQKVVVKAGQAQDKR